MNQPDHRSLKRRAFMFGHLAFWILFAIGPCMAQTDRVNVAEELERLMAAHGFTMKPADLEATRESEGRIEGDELITRLRVLLEGFDHIIVQKPGGSVDRVLILGAKVPYTPPPPQAADSGEEKATETEGGAQAEGGVKAEIILETQRKGTSHAMTLTIEGENGKRVQQVMLLDTGADFVVLPSSLIAPLGLRPNNLRRQSVQTANGTVDAQLGTLAAVWLGNQRVPGIAAAFIDDARLGGNSLLGMSVLGRFRVTIDDENNQVVLAGK